MNTTGIQLETDYPHKIYLSNVNASQIRLSLNTNITTKCVHNFFEQVPPSDDNQMITDIMNCTDDACDEQNLLADRDELAPFSARDAGAAPVSDGTFEIVQPFWGLGGICSSITADGHIDLDNITIQLLFDVIRFRCQQHQPHSGGLASIPDTSQAAAAVTRSRPWSSQHIAVIRPQWSSSSSHAVAHSPEHWTQSYGPNEATAAVTQSPIVPNTERRHTAPMKQQQQSRSRP